jgi:circadian clock protein KaiC
MTVPSGISGLDQILTGGLPAKRITVISGDPGNGKTVFSLQFLVEGVRTFHQSGIFVSFEESQNDISDDAASFGWTVEPLGAGRVRGTEPAVYVLEANLTADVVQAGAFDLGGLLAVLDKIAKDTKAERIVFDGLDVLLDLLENPAMRRREILRIRDWVQTSQLTAIITCRAYEPIQQTGDGGFLRYIASCWIILRHTPSGISLQRTVEVAKLRGSPHSASPYPFIIGAKGVTIGDAGSGALDYSAGWDYLSSGIARLDTMLGGGYLRNSSILISGAPGTAKTTLCGFFVNAMCNRGERCLFVSFDESGQQLVRDLSSVGLHLQRHIQSEMLTIAAYRVGRDGPEQHYSKLIGILDEVRPSVLVIDPLSALTSLNASGLTGRLVERVIDEAKRRNITVMVTSLLDGPAAALESTRAHISGIADSWVHLSFEINGGERNRAITVVKSRGSAHSNQVRELLLSADGADLADIYSASGVVLMGTARLEKEEQETATEQIRQHEHMEARRAIENAEALARLRLLEAQTELAAIEARRETLTAEENFRVERHRDAKADVLRARSSDSAPAPLRRTP